MDSMESMDLGLDLETLRHLTDMPGLQAETGCSGASCDAILQEFAEHPKWFCDSTPASKRESVISSTIAVSQVCEEVSLVPHPPPSQSRKEAIS